MATSFKNPPTFDPRSMTYETWKNEISVWQLVTDLKVDKQALAVSLTLTGNAREVAMDVPAADLAKEDGMAKLITQLDKAFLRDDKDKAYEAYKNFDTFVKTENLSMSDYIIEFDKRYSKSKKYDMTLPEAVLAFKLLDNAGLSSRDKQLALTASSDVKYTSMKSALQRIFGERMSGPSEITGNCSNKASLKKAGTVLDLKNDRAIMFNKPVELEFTSSGHYCVNIVKTKPEIQNLPVNVEENVLNITDDMSTAEKRKTLVKVHKQFGHATFNRLSKLLNKAGMNNADTLELLRSVCENCDICMTNKRPSSKTGGWTAIGNRV
ncbi:Hypothetical predicted protein [Mytilus galloprovincialis]|uniref:Uncharacterized protein n=1 Tax=Mytilus galloprovincialis TaxID=29158 RepID=A0A8B6DBQ0_MYTGA|nr:Hypothetical predicted protein [Mytilus galloprovincialis]